MPHSPLDLLRTRARDLLDRSHVPFSESPTAAALLLDDGTWIPGVRVESASFSLTLPALLNAYTTAVAAGRGADVVAFVLSRPFRREERLYVEELPYGPYEARAADAWRRGTSGTNEPELPNPTEPLSPTLSVTVDEAEDGVAEARSVAEAAYVPASQFRVGALLELEDGRLVPGVNVEHTDWARILCGERNAVGTAYSYALPSAARLYLSCPTDPEGTPCGACRQVLAELAPNLTLWMDRHDAPPEQAALSTLLPGSFRGRALLDHE